MEKHDYHFSRLLVFFLGFVSAISSLSLFLISRLAQPVQADSSNTVRVGWYESAGLQDGQRNEDLGGYNYEYLCKIAQYSSWHYEFYFGNWSDLEQKLMAGEIDLLGDVAQTADRLNQYNFCTYPNGYSRMLMITRGDDRRLFYNDYDGFNNIKVATIHSSFRKSLLDREAALHHFAVTYVEYDNDKELFAGLDKGEADAAIISNVTRYQNYRVVSEWEPNPFYFVVNKAQTTILSELNGAMTQIQSSDIFMQERLFEKYFEDNDAGSMIALSKEEDAYIRAQGSAKVLLCGGERPIAYEESGKAGGIVPDYLALLKEKTGLAFTYESYPNHAEMLNAFQAGKGQICAQFPDDFQYGQDHGAMLSQPFINLTYGVVSTAGKIDGIKKVAYEEGDDFLAKKIAVLGYLGLPYPNTEAMFNALIAKSVDGVVVNSMVYEQFSYHAKYRDFSFYVRPELNMSLCLGIAETVNPLLLTALDKAAGAVTATALENIRISNSTVVPEWTLADYFQTNGVTLLFLLILLLFIVALVMMIIHQKKLNHKLEMARKEADEANQAKSTFLSSMSHDLRTPLNGIAGFAGLALRENDPTKKQAYLENIKTSSDFLTSLVNDTLELSRIESGKMEVEMSEISCHDLSESVLSSVRPLAEKKHITLRLESNRSEDQMVWVDALKVEKIMLNLLSNAVKYTPEGGTVVFKVEEINPPVGGMNRRISVEDNGIGMSEEFQKHLYEPFAQEHRKEAGNVAGTGLGLSIVKRIVGLLGGNITVHSEVGKGTRFVVELPIQVLDLSKEKKKAVQPLPFEALRGKHILLVEDNAINAQIATILLEEKGIIVTSQTDGEKGYQCFHASPIGFFDAILMDLRMPVMDGYASCRAVRADNRPDASRVPIIAMTADAFEEQLNAAKEAGMNGAVIKPIDPHKLFEELLRLLAPEKETDMNDKNRA